MAERVDLVSVLSRQEMVTFWERLVQPHVFFALASGAAIVAHIMIQSAWRGAGKIEWRGRVYQRGGKA